MLDDLLIGLLDAIDDGGAYRLLAGRRGVERFFDRADRGLRGRLAAAPAAHAVGDGEDRLAAFEREDTGGILVGSFGIGAVHRHHRRAS